MKKTITTATLTMLALMAGGVAAAQADTKPADRNADMTRAQLVSRLDAQFAKLDTNRDGNITQAERTAMRDARVTERFQRLDTDKNGSITLDEFKARQGRGGKAEGRGGPRGKHHGMRGGRGMGGMNVDANKDGMISKAEFQAGPLARFDRMDTDKNGIVTAAERQAARAAMKGARNR